MVTGGFWPTAACGHADPDRRRVNVGENGSAAQFVDVNVAWPVIFWFGLRV